jgi:phospholipid/cholesterol/gamma-HCH transport system substrate-binding protein
MKKESSRELRVGALIAIGFLIIFGAFFVIGGQEGFFTQKYEIKVRFENVEGLTVGAPVRLGGVKVGSVSKINFTPGDEGKYIIVTLSVSNESFIRIREDSNARLGSQGLLGDRTVDISVGSPESPRVRQGSYIGSIEATQFDDLISKSGDALTDLKVTAQNAKEISWKINHGDGSMAQIINDPRLYVSLDSLLDMWSSITLKINKGQGFLAQIVNDPSLYNNLTSSLGEMRALLASLNAGQGSLGRMVKDDAIYNRLDTLLTSLGLTLTKLNNGDGTAGQMINNDDLYVKVNSTMDALNSLISDIQKNPKKYVKLSLF